MKQQLSPIISELLTYARLAPSVHNAQPWKFVVDDNTVTIVAEPERMLGPGDPTGRESWISFGICLETLLQAAKGLGLEATITQLQTTSLSEPIATVEIGSAVASRQIAILEALKNRHTYREKMAETTVPTNLVDACKGSVQDLEGVEVLFMQDRPSIAQVADFTFNAMSLALSDPGFRQELYHYIHYSWSPAKTGMHGYALGEGWLGSLFARPSVRLGIGLSLKAKHDKQRIADASALVFIATKGDVPSFWLNAGRGYLRVALEIAKTNLVQGTLAAPVEAASFHEDIEKILHTQSRIQTMLRIGKATHIPKRTSPRLDVNDLIT